MATKQKAARPNPEALFELHARIAWWRSQQEVEQRTRQTQQKDVSPVHGKAARGKSLSSPTE